MRGSKNISRLLSIIPVLVALVSCGGGGGGDPKKTEPNVNRAPVFSSNAAYSMLDGSLETGYQAAATDADGDEITYRISGGVDQAEFLINPQSGAVTFVNIPDFEAPHDANEDNVYEINIMAMDAKDAEVTLALAMTVSGNKVMIRIPIVVHVLYNDDPADESNISDAKILSQISVLNKDFRKKNSDLVNVPDEFKGVIADTEIEFEMATLTPSGEPTNGITRTLNQTTEILYGGVHFTSRGGHDAWPTDRYLNIWIIDGRNRNGALILLGRAQQPGEDPLTDGILVSYQVYGTLAPLATAQDLHLGRTTTHEIGHWLSLIHIDAGESCDVDDEVDDTPLSSAHFPKHPTYPYVTCGSSDMFMNFMAGYVADDELLMFTEGQKARMHSVFINDPSRARLFNSLTD